MAARRTSSFHAAERVAGQEQGVRTAGTVLNASACDAPGPDSGKSERKQHKQQQQQHERQCHQQQQEHQSLHPGDVGYYYELASDWAFMVPMAELAEKPGTLPLPLYLYEPSLPHQDRKAPREAVIGKCKAQAALPIDLNLSSIGKLFWYHHKRQDTSGGVCMI
jgi:hypothetical protein